MEGEEKKPPEELEPAESPEGESPEGEKEGIDLRVLVIIVLVLGVIGALYIRKKMQTGEPISPLRDQQQPMGPGRGPGQRSTGPPLTPAEQYARLEVGRRDGSASYLFDIGGRTYIVASPGRMARKEEGLSLISGEFYDITTRKEGLEPDRLYRREFGRGAGFRDTYVPLGFPLESGVALRLLFAGAEDVPNMAPSIRVIGIAHSGEVKAYPISMTDFHDIINDEVGGTPVLICWNALADLPVAFVRQIEDEPLQFGSAGLMYRGGTVAYDLGTKSLWSALTGDAIAGDLTGKALQNLPVVVTNWAYWKKEHPDTQILIGTDPETGMQYGDRPPHLKDYMRSPALYYPVEGFDPSNAALHPKARVFGVSVGGQSRAYPYAALVAVSTIEDECGGKKIKISYNREGFFAAATDAEGEEIPGVSTIYIVWKGLHPETDVYRPKLPELPGQFGGAPKPAEPEAIDTDSAESEAKSGPDPASP